MNVKELITHRYKHLWDLQQGKILNQAQVIDVQNTIHKLVSEARYFTLHRRKRNERDRTTSNYSNPQNNRQLLKGFRDSRNSSFKDKHICITPTL